MSIPASAKNLAACAFLLLGVCLAVVLADNLQSGGMVRGGPDLHHFVQRLWPFAVLLALGLAAVRLAERWLPRAAVEQGADWILRRSGMICAAFMGLPLCGSLAAVWVLRDFPNSGDENSYLFGARTFVAGRLWNPEPINPNFFTTWHILEGGGKWVSQYEPGWAGVLGAFHWLGVPFWAVDPVIGACLLAVVARIAWRREGVLAAILWLGLVALSPFYIFTAASYFNHALAALGGALFVGCALLWLERPAAGIAFCAGAALGVVVLVRPFDSLIFAIPFAVTVLIRRKWGLFLTLPWMVAGACPFLAALLLYYNAISGSPFVPPATLTGPALHLGLFPVMDTGVAYTPLDTLEDAVTQIVNLGEWTSPAMLLAYLAALIWRRRDGKLEFFDWIFPLNVLLYMLHAGSGGDRYGPRYYFEAYPFFALTIAAAAASLLRRPDSGRRAGAAAGLMAVHLATCIAALTVLPYFLREMVDGRMDPYDQAARAGLNQAVVVLRAPTAGTNRWYPLNLTRNGISLDGPVIYTLDPGARLPDLKAMFPARHFFAYERLPQAASGYLKPL